MVVGHLVYTKIYAIGFEAAQAVCEKRVAKYEERIKEYSDNLNARISSIETNSTLLLEESSKAKELIGKEFKDIRLLVKGKPLYTINAGKCEPSPDFVKAYNDAIRRANK
jgi:ribosomal protein S13